MTTYYFGTVNYINEDAEFNSQTDNNKFFETEDELVQDIVNGGHMAKLMENVYDELPDVFEEKLRPENEEEEENEEDYTWSNYFSRFPIKNKDELEEFVEKIETDDSWLDIKFHNIVYGKNKRIREGVEEDEESSNKKSKNE